jgi:hypothetical protein
MGPLTIVLLQQIDILGASPNWLGRPYWPHRVQHNYTTSTFFLRRLGSLHARFGLRGPIGVEEAYTQQGRAHIRRLHPDWAARLPLFGKAAPGSANGGMSSARRRGVAGWRGARPTWQAGNKSRT